MNSGNAPSGAITQARRQDRAVDELVGLCRGVLADGHVNELEAAFVMDWIARNSALIRQWPFDVIYSRLEAIFADGIIDSEESADLHDTLVRFVGGEAFDARSEVASLSTALPIDDPAPPIVFPDMAFVVTGTFSYGKRRAVATAICERGGQMLDSVSGKMSYLVIGELGSRDWMHSNAGRKIERAVELRNCGKCSGAIVSETHWAASL